MSDDDASRSIEEVSMSDLSAPARLAVRKELRRLESLLGSDEVVQAMARGAYKGRFGLVAVTSKRVVFVDRAKIQSQTAGFSLGRIRKIETGVTPMGYGRLEIYLAADDLPLAKEDVPSKLRFKVLPKTKTSELAECLARMCGIGKVTDVGMLPDESIEAESGLTAPMSDAPSEGEV